MSTDTDEIRALVQAWQAASRAGDVEAVLALMSEDALFLQPGQAPMDRQGFAARSAPPAEGARPKLDVAQEIHEIEVSGDLAVMRASLTVSLTPADGSAPVVRQGPGLTVFRRVAGRWRLARDANLLTPAPAPLPVAAPAAPAETAIEPARQWISSGSRFEAEIGYARAVAQGDWVFVSGTTGFDYATMSIADDVEAQTAQCLKNIAHALAEAGASLRDVVRVHYLLPEAEDFPRCWPLLREHFGEARPAATMIVARLLDPRMRIEIEVTALRAPARGAADGE